MQASRPLQQLSLIPALSCPTRVRLFAALVATMWNAKQASQTHFKQRAGDHRLHRHFSRTSVTFCSALLPCNRLYRGEMRLYGQLVHSRVDRLARPLGEIMPKVRQKVMLRARVPSWREIAQTTSDHWIYSVGKWFSDPNTCWSRTIEMILICQQHQHSASAAVH